MTVQEILAKKLEDAEAAKQATGAEEEPLVIKEEDKFGDDPEVHEGQMLGTIQDVLSQQPTAFALAASYDAPEGSYHKGRVNKLILANGNIVLPNVYGYYEAPEGEVLALLQYFEKQGLVTLES